MIKNILKSLAVIFSLVIVCAVGATVHAEQINSFDTNLVIKNTGQVEVTERITYDFGAEFKHGIFRKIPLEYERNGSAYTLRLSTIDVSANSLEVPIQISYPGKDVEIKIGDVNKTVTGVQNYLITYTVDRAINFFNDYDELYWNVTGNEWTVPVLESSAVVLLEGANSPRATCFIGLFGSQEPCTQSFNGSTAYYAGPRPLAVGEGLTVVYGFSKGIITPPTQSDNLKYFIQDNWIVVIPFIIFFLMLHVWRKYGRDPKGRGTVVPEYEPPQGLTPLEVGVLVDEKVDSRDLSAEIVYLATQGYIKITREEKKKLLIFPTTDYKLAKLKEYSKLPNLFDRKLLDMLFGKSGEVNLSELKANHAAFMDLSEAKQDVQQEMVSRGYFVRNPVTTKIIWTVAAFVIGFIVIVLCTIITHGKPISFPVGIVSGLVVLVFGLLMPARTNKGVEARDHALGLKEYITVAEKDRLAFHNDPKKSPERFDAILPFAIALGVDKAWAKVFEGIDLKPTWYNDPTHTTFNAFLLASSLGDFSNSVAAVAPPSSAGGGGSGFSGGGSGGGFGGGGGGSW